MKIQLIERDGKFPNNALLRLGGWHFQHGDEVRLFRWPCEPWGDKAYCSTLFSWSKSDLPDWAEIGGPGYDLVKVLPPEIENTRPLYSLYPDWQLSTGYTFRHCPRHCEFCIVGKLGNNEDKKHYSIYDWWDPSFKSIMLLNNNTFYDPKWRETFHEIWDNDLMMWDGNGYDARLLDEEKIEYLYRSKWKHGVHFAFDRHEDWSLIEKACKLICSSPLRNFAVWYVMTGWKYTFQQDLDRINLLRDYGMGVQALQFRQHDPVYMALYRWTFNRRVFFKVSFRDFVFNFNRDGPKWRKSDDIRDKIKRNLNKGRVRQRKDKARIGWSVPVTN